MKIRLTTYVDVDPDAWATEYGIDRKDVRQDVKEYFRDMPDQIVIQNGLNPKTDSDEDES